MEFFLPLGRKSPELIGFRGKLRMFALTASQLGLKIGDHLIIKHLGLEP